MADEEFDISLTDVIKKIKEMQGDLEKIVHYLEKLKESQGDSQMKMGNTTCTGGGPWM